MSQPVFPLSCACEQALINTWNPAQQQSGVTQGLALPIAHFKFTAVIGRYLRRLAESRLGVDEEDVGFQGWLLKGTKCNLVCPPSAFNHPGQQGQERVGVYSTFSVVLVTKKIWKQRMRLIEVAE